MPFTDIAEEFRFAVGRYLIAYSPRTLQRNRQYRREAEPAYPLPPERLLVEVAGSADLRWFVEGGQLALESIRASLATQGVDLEQLSSVLDFGCGVGRVLRHWPNPDRMRLHGTDINPALIRWSSDHLPFAAFRTNRTTPPLEYADSTFDLIYALSVFTHLPEDLQTAWIDELTRVLEAGGFLLITVHGDHYLPDLDADEQRRFRKGRLVVRNAAARGSNLCAAFHPEPYIRDVLARDLELVAQLPETATGNPFQDIVLLRKSARA
jgi:SAM-dependent methyltransferase